MEEIERWWYIINNENHRLGAGLADRVESYYSTISIRSKIVFFGFFVALLIGVFSSTCFGYEVNINGKRVGYTKDATNFTNGLNKVEQHFKTQYGIDNLYIAEDIEVKPKFVLTKPILDEEDFYTELCCSDLNVNVRGYALQIDGVEVGSFTSEEQAQKSVQETVNKSANLDVTKDELVSYEIKEDIQTTPKTFNLKEVRSEDLWSTYLLTGDKKVMNNEEAIANQGLPQLASRGDFEVVAQPEEAQPEEAPQVVENVENNENLVTENDETETSSGFLKINVVKRSIENEVIPFSVEEQDDPNLFVGQEKVLQEGVDGQLEKEIEYTYQDGEVVEANQLSERIVAESVKKIVAKGVKNNQTMRSKCGRFILPSNGNISAIVKPGSHAGGRAVDIANSTGTPIFAVGDGVVTKAEYYGGYGNCIIVDMGNGDSYLIGHMSAFRVGVGDHVTQGQIIGDMGSTGNSSGPHAHLELYIGGVQQVITEIWSISEGQNV
ncbi:MAG: peptidoglycan DD-metalloendopeptidase family protein [Eubacteriaceae bacterium]|nr:peptidoglycan DD-metalloendopeptidase family protein [Eubacteriaceae bacterium]